MNQNRKRDQDMPNRSSNMEPAEGSRDTVRNSQSEDLGTSSDRAMFSERVPTGNRSSERSGERGAGRTEERGSGSAAQRDKEKAGGISNRPLDREQHEQDRVPDRGRSSSEE